MQIDHLKDDFQAFLLDAVGMLAFFVIVQVGGVFFAKQQPSPSIEAASATSDIAGELPSAPPPAQVGIKVAVAYILFFLFVTLCMLAAIKYDKTDILQYAAYPIIYISFVFALALLGLRPLVSMVLAVAAPVIYSDFQTWYVVTSVGLVLSIVSVGAFAILWSPVAILVIMAAFTVYDAIAVYVTGHMQKLARGVGDKLPLFVVIPHSKTFALSDIFEVSEDGKRHATALGLGDLIIPSTLGAVAAKHVGEPVFVLGTLEFTAPAIGAMLGTLIGSLVLTFMLYAIENAGHAGLPPLNIGAIAGYLIAGLMAGLPLLTLLGL